MSDTIDAEFRAIAVREATPVQRTDALPLPIVTPQEAQAHMVLYGALVEAVCKEDDYQGFPARVKDGDGRWVTTTKRFKKKSAWRKISTFFGISTEKVGDSIRDDLGDGHFGFRCTMRAIAPNGRKFEAEAGCSTFEEKYDIEQYADEDLGKYEKRRRKALARSYHDILATAQTRATNRAISDLIGSGEVSAEEMQEPRPEKLVERAARLGIGDLRKWCDDHLVAYNQAAIKIALDELEFAALAPGEWQMSKSQKGLLFALHGQAGQKSREDRIAFYREQSMREDIESSSDLTRAEFDRVVKALEALAGQATRDEIRTTLSRPKGLQI